jgi:hypothetical protein
MTSSDSLCIALFIKHQQNKQCSVERERERHTHTHKRKTIRVLGVDEGCEEEEPVTEP